ncbi:Lipocalin-like domain-containing protein [Salinimicrobium sediminis]|uniref:Lipocalin-like domain-containing protein n=1 Tax=Salinimicrobium sediminis TaxID=1343891 RepID=A0A285X8H4_9FLAO|nr:lipocalin family protein [Salinimicrobium sediminis]SOC81630.1 Lipocalin-like domain-containing protein [Salinimicrobium sediminis]
MHLPFSTFALQININRSLIFLFLILITGCSKDDDEVAQPQDEFYKDALTSASIQQLSGVWAIYEVAFEGKSANVAATYEECGRDFFQFTATNTYRDYYYTSSYQCEKEVQDLNYDLEKGVVTLHNDWGASEEMVITGLTSDKLVFKMKMDIDDDPDLEVLIFVARRYSPPNDLDLYSYTFGSEITDENRNEIKFTWQAYNGFYKFDRYEIYRSDSGCSKANATLVASIKESSKTFFIDENPPVAEEICYYLKIFNEKGLIGESELITFFTEDLRPVEVEFVKVEMQNAEVKLEWAAFEGKYFSHYEIRVRNYKGGTGYGYQEYPVAVIEDKEITSYVDKTPPRLKDPVYAIYAYDIFGNVNTEFYAEKNAWELNWTHPEVVNLEMIEFAVPAPNSSEIFFYGRTEAGEYQLIKYNYGDHTVSATASKPPQASTGVQMQVHSTQNETELFFAQGNALAVYNAADLSYKYTLKLNNAPFFYDFAYLGDNIYGFTDNETLYTFKRSGNSMEFIAKKSHFTTHYGNTDYHLLPLKNREILVGHYREPKSYKFTINAGGEISGGELVNIPITSRWQKKTLYSPDQNYVINLQDNKLFSTLTWSEQGFFETPQFPTGISRDGNLILGSNNDPTENITNESFHEKKVKIYNLTTSKVTTVAAKGYPHLLFENHLGQIISISSGFKREDLKSATPKPDIFVEVIGF